MKIKELISQLKLYEDYNPQARVIIQNGEDGDWSYPYKIGWVYDEGEVNKNLVELS
jgi:hypothetical protein